MREVLFRAKDKNGNWIEGLPFYSHGLGEWKITHSNGWTPSYSNPDEGESTEYTSIDYNTLCKYTGLKDKNGTKIFEGDICEEIYNPIGKSYWQIYTRKVRIYYSNTGVGTQCISKHLRVENIPKDLENNSWSNNTYDKLEKDNHISFSIIGVGGKNYKVVGSIHDK
mgnify:CR=1 FL=1